MRYLLKQTTDGALSVRSFCIMTHIWSNSKSKSVLKTIFINSEAVARRCSVKKMFLKVLQTLQENTCTRISFLIKRLWHRCFPVIFVKFLRTPFFRTPLDNCFYHVNEFEVVWWAWKTWLISLGSAIFWKEIKL